LHSPCCEGQSSHHRTRHYRTPAICLVVGNMYTAPTSHSHHFVYGRPAQHWCRRMTATQNHIRSAEVLGAPMYYESITVHHHHYASSLSLCAITVQHHCAPSLCAITVHHHCASSLCIITVHHYCASSLCSITVHCHCAPSPYPLPNLNTLSYAPPQHTLHGEISQSHTTDTLHR